MGQYVLLLVVALTVGAVVFGVTVLVSGGDPGLDVVEPDGRAVPLPGTRPLVESDIATIRFDTGLRGYRMAQVDRALHRAAYDIGYKDELIGVLEAEVEALRDGRLDDAEVLRQAREAARAPGELTTEPVAEPVAEPRDASVPVDAPAPVEPPTVSEAGPDPVRPGTDAAEPGGDPVADPAVESVEEPAAHAGVSAEYADPPGSDGPAPVDAPAPIGGAEEADAERTASEPTGTSEPTSTDGARDEDAEQARPATAERR